jgi:hypothetical protein
MKTRRFWLRGVPVALLLALLALPAAGQQLALLRVESLDGAFADLEALARAVGTEFERGTVLGPAMQQFGIDDPSILDFERPLVMVMPMEGMMMQQRGIVAAFPVTDAEKVFGVLAESFAGHEELEGLHTYSNDMGPVLHALFRDGYVIAGGSGDLVKKFDLGVGLDRGDGPPGNMMLDLYLEPVAPMLQMGLMQGKQQFLSQLERSAGDADSMVQPEDMRGLLDLYFTFIQNVLNNLSRIQISLQLDGSHVLLHERLVPKAGSTMAGLVGAQKGSFTELAGLVSPKSMMVGAGGIEMTPAFREALNSFLDDYIAAVRPMIRRMAASFLDAPADGESAAAEADALIDWYADMARQATACYRGDGAFSMDFLGTGGFSFTAAYGWNKTEACRLLPKTHMKSFGEKLAQYPSIGKFVSMSDGGTQAGTTIYVVDMDVKAMAETMAPGDPQMAEVIDKVYGEKLSMRMAYAEDLFAVVGGGGAEEKLSALLAKRGQVGLQGVKPSEFSPLGGRPGVFMRLDMGRFMESMKGWVPEEGADAEEFARVAKAFSGPAGRIPMAVVFDSGAATAQVAVPMATLESIGKMVAEEKARHEQAHEGGE